MDVRGVPGGAGAVVPAEGAQAARSYRPELQGLRALAALLVVAYHVWFDRVSGGVDVFFLISGFLVTGQLVRASSRGGIRFGPLWGRMIKRLFPAALTVLVAVVAASVLLLPEDRWLQTIREVVASALYVENWRLAADSVDYFAEHNTASVVQHYWSLSIQGQFYVVWPLLVALVAVAARAAGRSPRAVLGGTLTVVFAASLTYSVRLTAADQPLAYFHSLTRVWEFALGGLLALAIQTIVLPRGLRIVLGWAGVAGLVACGMVLQVGSSFPGFAALWPTGAALLVLVAGATHSRVGADLVLGSRPLEYLGNLSYALYLWHWPVLLFYLVVRDRTEVGLVGGAGIVALSLALAALTYHLVEEPLRRSRIGTVRSRGAYVFGALALVPVLVAAGAWQMLATERAAASAQAAGGGAHPGALARTPAYAGEAPAEADPVPSLVALPEDWVNFSSGGCRYSPRHEELQLCTAGYTGPGPSRRIVLVGDSHMQQFAGAFLPVAQRRGWQLTTMLKGACPFSTVAEVPPHSPACASWTDAAAAEILALRPDAVVTLASRNVRPGRTEVTPPGFVERWRQLAAAGIRVFAVRDNAKHDFSPPRCYAAKGPGAPECATPRAELFAPTAPYETLPGVPPTVTFLDFTDQFCTETACPPVVGNVFVHMDPGHISGTFMRTLAPLVEQRVVAATGW
ncbi:acyltransferase family protein [Prauserella shujinwangii]|uniref:acyltransferase family protein n=1 Tax=Prauserella shujinwangii TaxID=1453103 RepID=UPI003CCBC803